MDVGSVAPLVSDTDNLHTISAISTAPYEIESRFPSAALGFIGSLTCLPSGSFPRPSSSYCFCCGKVFLINTFMCASVSGYAFGQLNL